jgi:hypothetical protein
MGRQSTTSGKAWSICTGAASSPRACGRWSRPQLLARAALWPAPLISGVDQLEVKARRRRRRRHFETEDTAYHPEPRRATVLSSMRRLPASAGEVQPPPKGRGQPHRAGMPGDLGARPLSRSHLQHAPSCGRPAVPVPLPYGRSHPPSNRSPAAQPVVPARASSCVRITLLIGEE